MTRALLLALLLTSCACGPTHRAAKTDNAPAPGAAITWVDGKPDNADEILAALDAGWRAYEARYGVPKRRVREVYLYRRAQLPDRESVRGWTQWDTPTEGEAVIHLAIGQRPYPTRWWVHELHHAHVGDSDHERSDWLAVNLLDLATARESWGRFEAAK